MRACRIAIAAAAAWAGAAGGDDADGPDLSRRFPEIAGLIRHFEIRMGSGSAHVRLRVLTELTYFHARDSRLYPPFLRYLVGDPSPKVRWEAVRRLRAHGIFLAAGELPESFDVPLVGACRPGDEKSLAALRRIVAANPHPAAGWAASALAVAKDARALELLKPLTGSRNVFVRYAAAVAYLELGRRETALPLLRGIATTDTEQSGFYRLCSAEMLVRFEGQKYMGLLIEAATGRVRHGYADAGIDVLADLTGEYFATPEEWRAWWRKRPAATRPAPASRPSEQAPRRRRVRLRRPCGRPSSRAGRRPRAAGGGRPSAPPSDAGTLPRSSPGSAARPDARCCRSRR